MEKGAKDDATENATKLIGQTRIAANRRVRLYWLLLVQKVSSSAGTAGTGLLLAFLLSGFIIISSLIAAHFLSQKLHNTPAGFVIVGGFYGGLFLIAWRLRAKLLKGLLTRTFLKQLHS